VIKFTSWFSPAYYATKTGHHDIAEILLKVALKQNKSINQSIAETKQIFYELTITETIHIQNKGYKPIILRLDKCDIPDGMRPYTYLDLNGPIENIVAPGKNSRSWRQHLYPFLLSNLSMA
jgi:hypothetical protein